MREIANSRFESRNRDFRDLGRELAETSGGKKDAQFKTLQLCLLHHGVVTVRKCSYYRITKKKRPSTKETTYYRGLKKNPGR